MSSNITITTTVRPFLGDLSFTKDELYFFGWFGFIFALILLCAVCVGCRSCCCRACCFSRETRTNLYVCKLPKKTPGLGQSSPHTVVTIEPERHTNCAHLLIDCECNYRTTNLGCNCRGNLRLGGISQCSHCRVQPQSRCRVDKATTTGPGRGNRPTEFEYLHGVSSPAVRDNRGEISTTPERENFPSRGRSNPNQSQPYPPPRGIRGGGGDMGFKVPKNAWSYTNPNPPPNHQPAPQQNDADEDWG